MILRSRQISTRPSAFTFYVLRFTLLTLSTLFAVPSPAAIDTTKLPPPATNQIDYLRDIKPILDAHCLKCHGPEKPKSHFRIDDRAALLKGGENGTNVYIGRSVDSPLIHYVARIVPEMEMPPEGKGEPLTSQQIGLLRAWIDQGLPWGGAETVAKSEVSFTSRVGWLDVSGSEKKFREHQWFREGGNGGLQEFSFKEQVDPTTKFSVTGRALRDDYKVSLSLERMDLGFVRGGFEQYRKYYDDIGGYYGFFNPSSYHLNRDLHLDLGKAWFEVGLTKPTLPQIVLGYEYQFTEGAKSTLQWGPVMQNVNSANITKNIFPAAKDVNQNTHLLRLDASHDFGVVRAEDNFRYEFYNLDTYRANNTQWGQLRPETVVRTSEGYHDKHLANAFHFEKQLRDAWFVSAGYLYTRSDGDAYFHQNTVTVSGSPAAESFYGQAPAIILYQSAHTFNFNNALGPWQGFSFSAGLQTEWASQRGYGKVDLAAGNEVVPFTSYPAFIRADLDRFTSEENFALRYTQIPHTVLFAETRFKQEQIGQFEEQFSDTYPTKGDFLRDTHADNDWKEYRGGFHVSPWRWFSLNSHYAHRDHDSDFDHLRDFAFTRPAANAPPITSPNSSYSAFIRSRDTRSDEAEAKMVLRPASWLKTTFGYKRVWTDYHTRTDPLPDITTGARVQAGTYDADVYSVNAVITPHRQWYLSATFSYSDSRTIAFANESPAVAPYRGRTYSVLASTTYVLNEKTDLNAIYSFSHANYAQANEAAGLPLGIDYYWHGLQAGVRRKLWKYFTVDLLYNFYLYDEPTSRGASEYTAHGIFALLNVKWP